MHTVFRNGKHGVTRRKNDNLGLFKLCRETPECYDEQNDDLMTNHTTQVLDRLSGETCQLGIGQSAMALSRGRNDHIQRKC